MALRPKDLEPLLSNEMKKSTFYSIKASKKCFSDKWHCNRSTECLYKRT